MFIVWDKRVKCLQSSTTTVSSIVTSSSVSNWGPVGGRQAMRRPGGTTSAVGSEADVMNECNE
jgi:hypothetical protein